MPSSGCKKSALRSEEHTSELESHDNLVFRLLLETNKTGNLTRVRAARPVRALEWRAWGRERVTVTRREGGGAGAREPLRFGCAFFFFKEPGPPQTPLFSPPRRSPV